MNQVTAVQGEYLLIAINKLVLGIAIIATRQDEEGGQDLVNEATVALQQIGVPIASWQ